VLHNDFCLVAQELIRRLIIGKKLDCNNVSGRVKGRNSFIEKCKKDKYSHVSEITDIIGIGVITYLLKDVDAICALLESEFSVIESVDKADELNSNEFGYRSKHYILRLNDSRASLLEYMKYRNLYFEVQVKTLTQHAWAEISHDRLYKSKGDSLPKEIEREFNNLAACGESIDKNFEKICNEYDNYIYETKYKISRGDLCIEISTESLKRYFKIKLISPSIHIDLGGKDAEIINELEKFGIHSLYELDKIIPADFFSKVNELKKYGANLTMLLRQIMIIHDSKKFFEKSWGGVWGGLDRNSKKCLYQAYNIDIDSLKQEYLVGVEGELKMRICCGDLDIDINAISLVQYAMHKFESDRIGKNLDGKNVNIFDELARFGINTLKELDLLIPEDINHQISLNSKYSTNLNKLLRHIMIISDEKRYFTECWSGSWPDIKGAMGKLCQAYGIDTVELRQRYSPSISL